MTDTELWFKLWPIFVFFLGGAFWCGVLEFRVRASTARNKEQERKIERLTEKAHNLEVNQATWGSTLESIHQQLTDIRSSIKEMKNG